MNEKFEEGKRQSVLQLAKIIVNFNLSMLLTGDQAWLNAVVTQTVASY